MSGSSRWWAPGRANLIGDHTDYQLGWVLPFATNHGLTVTVDLTVTSSLEVVSTRLGAVTRDLDALADGPRGWSAYVDGAVYEILRAGPRPGGVRVTVDSQLPVGGGQASSAALTCAVLAALTEALGRVVDVASVAATAQRVENDYVGSGVGYMDPAAVMFGRADHALLIDTRAKAIDPVRCDFAARRVSLLLVDTLERHSTNGPEYSERVRQCRQAASLLSVASLREVSDPATVESIGDEVLRARARHVVTENRRVLAAAEHLRAGRVREVGELLVASHASLRDDFAVSTERLDGVVETALAAGAMGARLTGAGLGGSALVMVDSDRSDHVAQAVAEEFGRRQWGNPGIEVVSPGRGAHRLSRVS